MTIQSNPPHTASMLREEEILVNLEVQNIQTKGAIGIVLQIRINSFTTFSPSRRRMGRDGWGSTCQN